MRQLMLFFTFSYIFYITSIGIIFAPRLIFRKEMDNIFIIFCVHFQKLFVEFVVLLTKTLPKTWLSAVTAKCCSPSPHPIAKKYHSGIRVYPGNNRYTCRYGHYAETFRHMPMPICLHI